VFGLLANTDAHQTTSITVTDYMETRRCVQRTLSGRTANYEVRYRTSTKLHCKTTKAYVIAEIFPTEPSTDDYECLTP